MSKTRLAVVGGGQMARALIGGMIQAGVISEGDVFVVDPSAESQTWWREHHGSVKVTDDLRVATSASETVLLAVKPNVLPVVAQQEDGFWSNQLIVSIAAGIGLKDLTQWIGHQRVIRVMPNTPCLVGQGASAYCVGQAVTGPDENWIQSALSAVGLAAKVTEPQLDAVTGLSGSGPAYICLVIEALADGGVLAGLPRPLAMQLATQTVLGTAELIRQTQRHPGELKDAVASPGGTTIAAIKVLEDNGLRAALINAVQASTQKSRELATETQ